jgi:hypothetical protein
MTRIIAPMLSKNNIIILHHMTRRSVLSHLEKGSQAGIFLYLDKIYGEKRLQKKKINEHEALKVLQKRFVSELKVVYDIIENFREGMKSFEVFKSTSTNISANPLSTTISLGPVPKQALHQSDPKQNFTMFNQILHYLSMKEEIAAA